jgi:hypothetical protein
MNVIVQDDSASKRCKSMEEGNGAEENSGKGKAAQSSSENGGKKQGKDGRPVPDPHQDFIHVRARRGEATDSHSLAERVQTILSWPRALHWVPLILRLTIFAEQFLMLCPVLSWSG